MAKNWRIMRIADARKGKDFGVFRAVDVSGMRSPIYTGDAPCMLANCTRDEARAYVRRLEGGASVESIRYDRQCIRNMMHSGMN
jgi:hypothetical protein